MGRISLQVKASLENVANIFPDGEDFRWYLKLKCLNCGEQPEKWQYVTLMETMPIKGSRGKAHLVSKCKLCSRENSIEILRESLSTYGTEEMGNYKTIVTFDCRGFEPIDFSPRCGFTVEGEGSGTKFTDVNLMEKEWVDYDEKAQLSVGIYDLEHKFVKE